MAHYTLGTINKQLPFDGLMSYPLHLASLCVSEVILMLLGTPFITRLWSAEWQRVYASLSLSLLSRRRILALLHLSTPILLVPVILVLFSWSCTLTWSAACFRSCSYSYSYYFCIIDAILLVLFFTILGITLVIFVIFVLMFGIILVFIFAPFLYLFFNVFCLFLRSWCWWKSYLFLILCHLYSLSPLIASKLPWNTSSIIPLILSLPLFSSKLSFLFFPIFLESLFLIPFFLFMWFSLSLSPWVASQVPCNSSVMVNVSTIFPLSFSLADFPFLFVLYIFPSSLVTSVVFNHFVVPMQSVFNGYPMSVCLLFLGLIFSSLFHIYPRFFFILSFTSSQFLLIHSACRGFKVFICFYSLTLRCTPLSLVFSL